MIQRVYAAPGSVEGWHDFLRDLCDSLSGSGANFISHDFTSHQASVSVTAGFAPADIKRYERDWAHLDPWARSPAVRRLPSGSVAVGEQLVTHEEMKRTAFYNDFGRHYDVVRCITGTIEVGERRVSVLSVNRGEPLDPFGQEESALLNELMPHLQRALQIHRRLVDLQGLAEGSTMALDLLAHGVLLLDRQGLVLFANRAAEELLRAEDGLTVHQKELRGAHVNDTKALRTLIGDVIEAGRGERSGAGGLLLVARPSGRAPLRVLVTPVVQRHVPLGAGGAAACVFVTDPERVVTPAPEHLRRVFGLSSAETRVATALMEGESVDRLADRLCISRNTARTHLRRLFEKTGTSRQAELIRVLLSAHPPVQLD